ncbi:MAG: transposase [Holosporaceae bacterium]|jgi:transposase|nr:transposase [Holosporaceae bacterium]
MNACSEDLRLRVIGYVESGHKYKEAAERFGVSERSICNWIKLKRETGSLKAESVPRSPHKLRDEELLTYVKENPDAFLKEIAEHFRCSESGVHKALKRNNITYKKTPFIPGKRRRETKKVYRFCKCKPEESIGLR